MYQGAQGLKGKSWPDLDMLPFGWLTDPDAHEGPHRSTKLTQDEQRTRIMQRPMGLDLELHPEEMVGFVKGLLLCEHERPFGQGWRMNLNLIGTRCCHRVKLPGSTMKIDVAALDEGCCDGVMSFR
ncbi:Aldolase-type TIM barrel [Vigna unguiculata]|uniref:Aldolase-type TIM barrel n=1 Tax=Vigna unguiculata TaxID=3917 RepID=A0A4D6M0C7_VIGUN|nr:Aldolase-type TIM barrel [Vigna unguiculata]